EFLGGHCIPPGSASSSLAGPGQCSQGLESSISHPSCSGCAWIFYFDPGCRRRLISLIAPPSIAPLMRARLGDRRGGELRPHHFHDHGALALLFLVASFVV